MNHYGWEERETIKKIECINNQAEKYIVNNTLTVGKKYDVKNETDEFYFITDNSNRIGGFFKKYFKEHK